MHSNFQKQINLAVLVGRQAGGFNYSIGMAVNNLKDITHHFPFEDFISANELKYISEFIDKLEKMVISDDAIAKILAKHINLEA